LHKDSSQVGLVFGICLATAPSIFLPIAHAQAQAFSAWLAGVAHDRSGAAIPAAKVTPANPEKSDTHTFSTDGEGGDFCLPCSQRGLNVYGRRQRFLNLQTGA
jgi:hypothetical protein